MMNHISINPLKILLMTVSFKSFRADVQKVLHHIAESESFRTTGDCSIHHVNKENCRQA